MIVLSTDPTIQRVQLDEILATSEKCLKELTAPVDTRLPYEQEEQPFKFYDENKYVINYQPPTTRFGRFSSLSKIDSNTYDNVD